jgi:hypothetical protein
MTGKFVLKVHCIQSCPKWIENDRDSDLKRKYYPASASEICSFESPVPAHWKKCSASILIWNFQLARCDQSWGRYRIFRNSNIPRNRTTGVKPKISQSPRSVAGVRGQGGLVALWNIFPKNETVFHRRRQILIIFLSQEAKFCLFFIAEASWGGP